MDFVENKPPFIHCNIDIEGPSNNTLMHFDIINCSKAMCHLSQWNDSYDM